MAYSYKQRADKGFDFFNDQGKKVFIDEYVNKTGANKNQLIQKLAGAGDVVSQKAVRKLPSQFNAAAQPKYSPQVQARLDKTAADVKQSQADIWNPYKIVGDIANAAGQAGKAVVDTGYNTAKDIADRVGRAGDRAGVIFDEVSGTNARREAENQRLIKDADNQVIQSTRALRTTTDPAERTRLMRVISGQNNISRTVNNSQQQDFARMQQTLDPRQTLVDAGTTALDVATLGKGAALLDSGLKLGTELTKQTAGQLVKNTAKTTAQGGVIGGTYGGLETARNADATFQDYAQNIGTGAALGATVGLGAQVALPVAGSLAKAGVDVANDAAVRSRHYGYKPPTNLTPEELVAAQKVHSAQQGLTDPQTVTPQDTQLFQQAEQKLGHQPGTPDGMNAVAQALDSHRAFDVQVERRRQATTAAFERFKVDPATSEAGYIRVPGGRDGQAPVSDAPQINTMKPGLATRTLEARPEVGQMPVVQKSQLPANVSSSDVQLNTKRLGLIGDEQRNRLAQETSEIVGRLSNDDVKQIAQGAGIDLRSHGVEGTKKQIAKQLNVRNEIVTVESQIKAARDAGDSLAVEDLMKKSAELGRISRSQGTDLARQLQARRIIADTLATPQQKLFRILDEAGVDPDVYIKKLANIDLNNADEVIKAYRELVPAKFSDWLDKFRYTNMLSSPLTHIVNISSNIAGLGGVAPVQKLFEGGADAIRSKVSGTARTRYASEAGSYYSGVKESFPEAMQRFKNVMTGKQSMETPDADALKYGKLAHGGFKGVADEVFSVIPKLLEASDQFGMTLSRGGERAALAKRGSKGVALPRDTAGMVDDAAKYRVFRQELGKEGQGAVLDAVDFIPKAILQARSSKNPIVANIAKFTIPFVTTPTNLFKQGMEYSPVGFATLPGHVDKTGQAAKALMGTTAISLAAATFAASDSITFNEPSSAAERDRFRAEGKQPYAVKIGDNWVSYSKLHPAIAFNLAMVAATKQALDNGDIDESEADKAMNIAGGIVGYFRDQSFMKSVGDFTNAIQLKDGANLGNAIGTFGSNYANQLVPFKSLTSWIGRMFDPTQRKVDFSASTPEVIYQNLVKDIPGLNNAVPTRNNPYSGEPIKNDNPLLNSFSPLRVTNDKTTPETDQVNTVGKSLEGVLQAKEKRTEDYKKSFNDVDYKLLNLTKAERKELIDSGAVTQEKFDGLDSYAKNKKKELGFSSDSTASTKLAKDSKSYKFLEDSDALSDDEKKEWSTQKVSDDYKSLIDNVNHIKPDGLPDVPATNAVAKLYADFKKNKADKGWSELQIKKESKKLINDAYKSQLTDNEKFITSLSDKEILSAAQNNEISKDEIDRIIAVDNILNKLGMTQMIGNKTRYALGYGSLGSSSGGGGKKGGKGSKDLVATQNSINSTNASTIKALQNLLAGTTAKSTQPKQIGRKVALKKITVKGA